MQPNFITTFSSFKLPALSSRDLARHASNLLDPRGRCNRVAMTAMTSVVVAIQVVSFLLAQLLGDAGTTLLYVVNTPLLVVGLVVAIKRLHDIGLSAWWAPAMFFLWFCVASAGSVTRARGADEAHLADDIIVWIVGCAKDFRFIETMPAAAGFVNDVRTKFGTR